MRLKAYPLYLLIEVATSLVFSAIFTASAVYQITVAGLSPLQLVLVGTMLEVSAFVFEVPTGVIADVYSRRLSIVIGWVLMGLGFLLEGSLPLFATILLAQVLWGLGYTFTSGATQAWISDEIGEAAAGKAFLRGNQLGLLASLAGIGLGALLGSIRVNIPIQLGGVALILVGFFLALTMPETGFKPLPREERNSWQNMVHTFKQGWATVRRRPALLQILSIGLIYGLYSEGYDRLWTKHILDDFALPAAGSLQPVVWIGLIRAVGLLLSVGATELAQRKIDTASAPGDRPGFVWDHRPPGAQPVYFCTGALVGVGLGGDLGDFDDPQRDRPGLHRLGEPAPGFGRARYGALDEQSGGCHRANCRGTGSWIDRQCHLHPGSPARLQPDPDPGPGVVCPHAESRCDNSRAATRT